MFTFEYIFIEDQFIYFSSTSVRKWLKRKLEYKRNPRFLQCPLLPNTQCQDLQSRLWVSISLTLTHPFALTYLPKLTQLLLLAQNDLLIYSNLPTYTLPLTLIHSLTHSFTHSLTHSLIHSLTLINSLTHLISLLLTTQYNTTLFTLPSNYKVHSLSTRNLYSF